ncbi:Flp pilus assembly protein TadB [Paenibacillus amylolyticus]|uniref:Flp pilus assembly protein TadB n=1 Tax=Paenibacillus amylolyticus TaxID=1451 RepID=A0AAP5H5F4_PAEAM|nr:Flp pilus assembly protein TadB [Paenibacillus amylolyticus]
MLYEMKKMYMNLILSFLTGLLAFYVVTRTITITAIYVCIAATVIVALMYLFGYLLKKMKKKV